jgi:hypothetical protein
MSDSIVVTSRPARISQRWLTVALAVWVAALAAGFFALWRYKATAAVSETGPPARWPAESAFKLSPDRATLILFAHPKCGCTHATVTELARLLGRTDGMIDARVAVVRPAEVPPDWDDTELVSRASAIPGVRVGRDEGGIEAARFGVRASGHVVVYDRSGRRLFSGGLTSSRGHEGESFGSQRIFSLLTTGVADRADAPVFGCALGDTEMSMEEHSQ